MNNILSKRALIKKLFMSHIIKVRTRIISIHFHFYSIANDMRNIVIKKKIYIYLTRSMHITQLSEHIPINVRSSKFYTFNNNEILNKKNKKKTNILRTILL